MKDANWEYGTVTVPLYRYKKLEDCELAMQSNMIMMISTCSISYTGKDEALAICVEKYNDISSELNEKTQQIHRMESTGLFGRIFKKWRTE